MKLASISLMLLIGLNANASAIVNCAAAANKSGVVKIEIVNSQGGQINYDQMTVIKKDQSKTVFTAARAKDVISGVSMVQEAEFSFFKNAQVGIASVEHTFYTRPEDQNSTGFSSHNGVKLTVVLPPAVEAIALNCVRSM